MLVVFRSQSSGEFFMLRQHANTLLELMGKTATAQGIISRDEVSSLLEQLNEALSKHEGAVPEPIAEVPQDASNDASQAVGLKQRAWPLIEMLRKASLKQHDITWGV